MALNNPVTRVAGKAILGSILTTVGMIALHEYGIDFHAVYEGGTNMLGSIPSSNTVDLTAPLLGGGLVGGSVGVAQEMMRTEK